MFQKLYAIAYNTFIETVRQPIYGILMWVAVGLLVINPSLAGFSLEGGGDNKIMKDVAMSTMLLYGLLASVFSATGVITREIDSFTVLTVVSKPVSRVTFLLGKFGGVTGAILVGYYFLSLVFFMTARHGVMETNAEKFDLPVLTFSAAALAISLIGATFCNFVYGWHFAGTLLALVVPAGTLAVGLSLFFDREWHAQSPLTDVGSSLEIVAAITMIFFAVMILTAFAVAISTRFSQAATLILCAGIFMLGLLSDYYFGLRADESLFYQLAAAILPNFQFFWVGDALTQGLGIPISQLVFVGGYAILYTLAVLGVGVAMFQTREVG